MRDALGDAKQVAYTYTRYQDAVPFMVENTFTQAGATAASAATPIAAMRAAKPTWRTLSLAGRPSRTMRGCGLG